MSSGKVKCTCGWSWNKSDSSKKDMYICHECGRDNSNNISKAQEGIKSPNVWAQEQHFQEKKKNDGEYEKLIGNAGEEAIDIVQRFTPLKYLPGLGSTFAVGEAEVNNQDAALSDELGMLPLLPAQAASLMLLYAEKEKENFQKFAENRDRGKTYDEIVNEEDVNNRVIDKTYVPKPKIGELKETKKETKSKKVPYTEKKETNKVEIDNTRTVKPRVNNKYKSETKYKFDIPSITYSDDSFIMPREVNDTKIDNTYVAKPKRKDGGWLDSYADGGNIGDPKVGDPKPTYWKSKVYKGPTKFNECKGEGCSKQATKGVASLYNLDYSSLNPQDAWYKRSAVIKGGGKEIYNASSKNDINSVYGDLRVGDFVSLDRPGESHSKDVSKVEGYDLSDNEKTEHLGYVVGFDKNGTPLIKHGWEGNLISGAKSYVQPITNISLPDIGYDYTVNSIYRASPLLNNDKEVNNKYYKNISPSIPLSFDSKKNLTDDKQNFIDAYNKNSDKFQLETGLSPEEVAAIGNISYGIFGNESKFNESLKRPVKQIGAEALDFFGLKDTPPSLGPTQIKYDQVGGDKNNTRKSKLLRSLGVEKEDLNNVILPTDYDAVSKATFALLAENYRNLKTNPKFKYNSETNTVLGNVPIGVALAKSWQNPSLKNVEETLQAADSDYANSVYKNMSELEGNMFPVELKEVVIEGKKKENGGWLNKYADGGTMQEHQENYNNSQASAPEGMVGDGFSNVGRNYSPAWGGQFQMGGNVYPVNYVPQAQTGGSFPGATGFLYARTGNIPSKGPRRNQTDKTDASAQNGQEMKYYQEGLDWKPKTISRNGGWLDGYDVAQSGYTTGDKVTYGTPEYREAYNKGEVVTDEGVRSPIALDEVVIQNNYRRPRGVWEQYADKIAEENKDAGLLGAIIGTPISAVTSVPQLMGMKALTGEMQRPSEAMDIENPYGAFAVDAVTDPTNLIGAGILTKEKALARLSNLKNINAEGKIFSGMNNELNNMAIQNTERYMAKRTPTTSTLSSEMEPYVSRYTKLSDEPYIPYQEDEYMKWFNEQKAKMNPPVVKQDPRSILRSSSVIDINDVEPTKFNFIKQDLSEGNNIKYSFTNEQGNNIATFSGRKSPEGIYVNSIEVNPEFRRQGVASDIYKNIAKELQSKNEGTLFSRSGQHQFTDRDELGRSIAPANKLWENLVNKGEAEKFIEGMSHTYKINPLKQGGIIKDDRGQWAHPGEITEIGSNNITMQGVPYPVLGISNTGDIQMMYPGEDYEYDGESVTEFPMAKNGLRQEQKGLVNLDQLTNFTNYNKPQPGGWLNKYN